MGKKVVIIGGGMGGLVTACTLSYFGFEVVVLDMNKQLGGTLQTYARDKHVFDSGVHYIGGLGEGENLNRIFRFLGIMDSLKTEKMDEAAFDKIVFYSDMKTYAHAQGYDRFKETLLTDFPNEKVAIEKYIEALERTCEGFPMYGLRKGSYLHDFESLEVSTSEFIDSLTHDKRLRMVLGGNNPLYAGTRNMTPWYVHALITNSYVESSWKMVGGGSQIAKLLISKIRERGGIVKNRSKVVKLHETDSGISAAETEDGSIYHGDFFISSIHPAKTLQLTDSKKIKTSFRNRIQALENSISFFVVNITLKPNRVKNELSNYYCYMQDDVWEIDNYTSEQWPPFYALFFSSKDLRSEYAEGITLMTYMRYDEVDKWADSFNTVGDPSDRGEDYEAFKKEKTERLLDVAEKRFPGLKDAIKNTYASTPLTFRDYMGTADGSIYGIRKNCRELLKTTLSAKLKIDNLFITGQNLNLHGILGVTISALVTCAQLVGMDQLIDEINRHQDVN